MFGTCKALKIVNLLQNSNTIIRRTLDMSLYHELACIISLTNFERRFSQHRTEKISGTKTGKETLLSIRATAEIL